MNEAPTLGDAAITPKVAALQHGPRPLPLFLEILLRETQHDPALRLRALAGLKRYQHIARPKRPPAPATAAQVGQARLLHFPRPTGMQHRPCRPLVVIPSLINPPDVLDLSEQRSLMRWLAAQGHDAYLVDWGTPSQTDSALSLAQLIEDRLLPMVRSIGAAPVLVGYCLGGTLAIGAAAAAGAAAVVSLAAPWQFDAFPQEMTAQIAQLWSDIAPMCTRMNMVPMEALQAGFWALDPARTIIKYADFVDMAEDSDALNAFLALEDWANAGPPLPLAAARDLFESLYADNLTGKGQWTVAGSLVDAARLPCPSLAIASTTDRIVPAATTPPLSEQWQLALGHVGMIVGSKAQQSLWAPLSEWLFKHQA